jgi:hypothetical protein
MIIKNDGGYLQGICDLLILYKDKWGFLEVKRSADAAEQVNQKYYVNHLNEMSFAAFIYPENEEEVLSALQQAFEPPRRTRISKSKSVPLGELHTQ